jgi:hypothetical protein
VRWIVAALLLYGIAILVTGGGNLPLNDDLAHAGDPSRINASAESVECLLVQSASAAAPNALDDLGWVDAALVEQPSYAVVMDEALDQALQSVVFVAALRIRRSATTPAQHRGTQDLLAAERRSPVGVPGRLDPHPPGALGGRQGVGGAITSAATWARPVTG